MLQDSSRIGTSNMKNDDTNNKSKEKELSYPVWEFNYKPERYIHKSWLHALPNGDL